MKILASIFMFFGGFMLALNFVIGTYVNALGRISMVFAVITIIAAAAALYYLDYVRKQN